MAGIKFDITGDNQHFINSLTETRNAVRTTTKEIESQGVSIEKYFSNLKSAAMAAAAGFSAKQFINQMMQVRGEFQKLEVAFKNGMVITGKVIGYVQSGLNVIFEGVRLFVPASRIPNKDNDLKSYLGKKIECKIIEFNRAKNRYIGSQMDI